MKSPLKKILIPVLLILSAFISIVYMSCNSDKCKTIVCAYGGVCNQGSCICPLGYEGTNCETISNYKFLGNWTVFEKGSSSKAAEYPASIVDSTLTVVKIINFNDYFTVPVIAYVNNDTLTIPNQELQGKLIFGIGYVYSTATYGTFAAMSIKYEIIDTATNSIDDYGYNPADLSMPSLWNK